VRLVRINVVSPLGPLISNSKIRKATRLVDLKFGGMSSGALSAASLSLMKKHSHGGERPPVSSESYSSLSPERISKELCSEGTSTAAAAERITPCGASRLTSRSCLSRNDAATF